MNQNHILRGLLAEILTDVKHMKDTVSKTTNEESMQVSFFSKFDYLTFPINNLNDLESFENILSIKENFEEAVIVFLSHFQFFYMHIFQVREISKLGGRNNYNFVTRTMTSLMSNDIALQYSWLGRKGKKAFHNTNFALLIISEYLCIFFCFLLIGLPHIKFGGFAFKDVFYF